MREKKRALLVATAATALFFILTQNQEIPLCAGDEFYAREWPELEGLPFSTVMLRFPEATPIGVECDGSVMLNPPDSYVMLPGTRARPLIWTPLWPCSPPPSKGASTDTGDKVIVIAEDDDSYTPSRRSPDTSDAREFEAAPLGELPPEKLLFCGWRRDMHDMVACLDEFVQPGSQLWLYNNVSCWLVPGAFHSF